MADAAQRVPSNGPSLTTWLLGLFGTAMLIAMTWVGSTVSDNRIAIADLHTHMSYMRKALDKKASGDNRYTGEDAARDKLLADHRFRRLEELHAKD
jgi:hypothetical protein